MSVISEVKDTLIEAKKKYDKEKYINVLENQINILKQEIERLNTQISKLNNNEFILNSDHLELFKVFKENNYIYGENDIREYSKKSVNLEIALSELIDNNYFKFPNVCAVGSKIYLFIPEDKKIKFLQALKNMDN